MPYYAKGDKVYVCQPMLDTGGEYLLGKRELFLTVHPTNTGGTAAVEQQAIILAVILNDMESGSITRAQTVT